jgi:putative methionine-R-sulfoxide reductase with GAF domain
VGQALNLTVWLFPLDGTTDLWLSDCGQVMANEKRWERSLRALERSVGVVDKEFHRVTDALDVILEIDRRIFDTAPVLDDVFRQMIASVQRITKGTVQILLRQDSSLKITHSTAVSDQGKTSSIKNCVAGIAVEENRTVPVPDVQRKYPARYQPTAGGDMQSEVAAPIRDGEDIVGVLNVEWSDPKGYNDVDIEIIEQFALQAGAAMRGVRMNQAFQQSTRLAQLLHSRGYRDAIRETLQELKKSFGFDVEIQFLALTADRESLVIQASTEPRTENETVLVNDSVSGRAVIEGKAIRADDVWHEYSDLFKSTVEDKSGKRIVSELAVPILELGDVIGVLNVESPEHAAFTNYDEYLLNQLANAGVWHRSREAKHIRALKVMAAMGELDSTLVHDLINNNANIYDAIKSLDEEMAVNAGPERLKVAAERIRQRATAFVEHVESVRARYPRLLKGNSPTPFNRIIRDIATAVMHPSGVDDHDNGLSLEFALDEGREELDLPRGFGDIIRNLLRNAKAAIPSDRKGRIVITTRLSYGVYTRELVSLMVRVEDDGVGIPKEELEQIYDLKEKPQGHGYGMFAVKAFVDRCDGQIDIKSEIGKGTAITLTFPLTPGGAMRSFATEGEDES